ncbi:MAG: phytanoyl-CoA dioxygenase family protein [candidate division Zixibacteria bacterium]|nr:phytanoyl-CoA dioxygenase family protein [candidate division Zixibacteria bacterium]
MSLTPAQRYFYDVNGYVLLKNLFTRDQCRRFVEIADRMDAEDTCAYKHDGYPKRPTLTVLSRCAWYDPHLLDTARHPAVLPVIEEVTGGEERLEEHQYLINYPDPAGYDPDLPIGNLAWHRALGAAWGGFRVDGRYHCFVNKALIYLTDNSPNDGSGTWVVPGSHRMDTPTPALCAFLDASLCRQIEADTGDVLILSETLVHSVPRLKPGASPRYSLVYGYSVPFMQTWNRYDPPTELLDCVTPEQRRFLTGEVRYAYRTNDK